MTFGGKHAWGLALVFGLVLGLLAVVPAATAAAPQPDVVVNDDGTGDAAICGQPAANTIQGGIDLANPGDVIFVCDGTYEENVTVDTAVNLYTNESVTLQGSTQDAPAFTLNATDDSNATSLTGFTVNDYDQPIVVKDTSDIVVNDTAISSGGSSFDAIRVTNSSTVRLDNNTISANYQAGINLSVADTGSVEIEITNNSIDAVQTGIEISSTGSSTPEDIRVDENQISATGAAVSVTALDSSTLRTVGILNTSVTGAGDSGIVVTGNGGTVENTTVAGNDLSDTASTSALSVTTMNGGSVTDLNATLNDFSSNPTGIEVNASAGMIDGFESIENLANGSTGPAVSVVANDGGTIQNSLLETNALNDSATGLKLVADGGTIADLRAAENNASYNSNNGSEAIAQAGGTITGLDLENNTFANADTSGLVFEADGGDISDSVISTAAVNETTTGVDVRTNASGSLDNVTYEGIDARNTAVGGMVNAKDSTISGLAFEDALFNESSQIGLDITVQNGTLSSFDASNATFAGTGLNLTASNSATINGFELTDVNLSDARGLQFTAPQGVTLTDITLDGVLLTSSGSRALGLTADGGSIDDVTVRRSGLNESTVGLDVTVQNSGALTGLTLDEVDLRSTTNAMAITGTDGEIDDVHASTLLANESTDDVVTVSMTGSSQFRNATIRESALNDSTNGAGINLTASDSAVVDGFDLAEINASGNADGATITASDDATVANVSTDSVLFGASGQTALSFDAAGGSIVDSTVQTSGLNETDTGVRVVSTTDGSISNLTFDEIDARNTATGADVTANAATISGLTFSETLLNESTGDGLSMAIIDGTLQNVAIDNTTAEGTGINVTTSGVSTVSGFGLDTVDASGSDSGLQFDAGPDVLVEDVTISNTILGNNTGPALGLSADNGTVRNVELTEVGLNETDTGPGLVIDALNQGTITGISLDTIDARNTSNAIVITVDESTVEDVYATTLLGNGSSGDVVSAELTGGSVLRNTTITDSALNESTDGTGVNVTASGTSSVEGFELSTIDASENRNGANFTALDDAEITGIETDTVLFASESTALTLAANGGTISDTNLASSGLNQSDTGLAVRSHAGGTITGLTLDTIDLQDTTRGTVIDSTTGANVTDVYMTTVLANQSSDVPLAVSLDDATLENMTVTESALNDSGGRGLDLSATNGGNVTDLEFNTVILSNSTGGNHITAANDAAIRDVNLDSVLFGATDTTALQLNATGADLSNVTLSTVGLNDSATGLGTTITNGGSLTGLTIDTADMRETTVGANITADGGMITDVSGDTIIANSSNTEQALRFGLVDATLTNVAITQSALNDSVGTGVEFDARGSSAVSNVALTEMDLSNNGKGVSVATADTASVENVTFDTVLFAGSATEAVEFETSGGTVRNVTFGTTGLNESGTGLALTASGGEIADIALDENLIADNDNGIVVEASGDGRVSDLDVSENLISGNNVTGVGLMATDQAAIENVTGRTVALNETDGAANATALRVDASGSATISNLTVFEGLIEENTEGLNVSATDSALISDVNVTNAAFQNNTVGIVVHDGTAARYEHVNVTESLIRYNDVGVRFGSGVTTDMDASSIDVEWSLIEDNAAGVVNNNPDTIVDMTVNYWGAPTGPSSSTTDPLTDPTSDALADGDGDTVSEGATQGVSNVNFAPAIGGKSVCGDGQLFDPVPNETFEFSIENDQLGTVSIEGNLTNFVGFCVWERGALPLRTASGTGATSVTNTNVFVRANLDGDTKDVPINRPTLDIFQRGDSVTVEFSQTTGANVSRYADADGQMLIGRVTGNLSGAFNTSIDESTGRVEVGADAIEFVDARTVSYDANGELSESFTPAESDQYVTLLTKTNTGDGIRVENGDLVLNALRDDLTVTAIETVTVQETSSSATPQDSVIPAGEDVTFDINSNLDGNVSHALVLYDEQRFVDSQVVVTDFDGDFQNFTVRNGSVTAEVTTNGTLETVTLSTDGALGDNITVAGEIPTINSSVAAADSDVQSLTLPTNESFRPGEYRYVHLASGDDSNTSSTNGTIQVVAPANITVTSASLSSSSIEEGDAVDVTATLKNFGDTNDTFTANLTVDGQQVDSKTVSVDGGQTETVTFTRTFNAAGDYDVAVSEVSAGTLTVTTPGTGGGPSGPSGPSDPSGPSKPPKTPPSDITVPGEPDPDVPDRIHFDVPDQGADGNITFEVPETNITQITGARCTFITIRSRAAGGYNVTLDYSQEVPLPASPLESAAPLMYMNISYDVDPSVFESATFEFTVDNDRITGAPENVGLYRYNETTGDWEHFQTAPIDTSGDSTRFQAETDGFSVYAIAQQEPDFQVTDASLSDEEITVGDSVDVDATVENTGEGNGTYTVELTADGETIATKDVTLAGGESETITFTETFDTPGNYQIAVDGTSAGTLTVIDEGTATPTDTPGDGGDGLGAGLIIAVVVILAVVAAVAYYFYREEQV